MTERKISLTIVSGDTTCHTPDKLRCPAIRLHDFGRQCHCSIFNKELTDDKGVPSGTGWLQRLPECLQAEEAAEVGDPRYGVLSLHFIAPNRVDVRGFVPPGSTFATSAKQLKSLVDIVETARADLRETINELQKALAEKEEEVGRTRQVYDAATLSRDAVRREMDGLLDCLKYLSVKYAHPSPVSK